MSTAYADLESRNQQLELRVIELEAEQSAYRQFQLQITEELEALRKSRRDMQDKVSEMRDGIAEERQQYKTSLLHERDTNNRLRTQLDLLQQQKQEFDKYANMLKQQHKLLEQELLSKTLLINNHFSRQK